MNSLCLLLLLTAAIKNFQLLFRNKLVNDRKPGISMVVWSIRAGIRKRGISIPLFLRVQKLFLLQGFGTIYGNVLRALFQFWQSI